VDSSPPSWTGFVATLVALSLLGAVLTMALSFGFAMSSDGCGGTDSRYICSGAGQNIVFWLPWAGLLSGILFSPLTAGFAARRGWSHWLGIPVGVLIYVVALGVAFSIAAS
jgi:hypothetical protein